MGKSVEQRVYEIVAGEVLGDRGKSEKAVEDEVTKYTRETKLADLDLDLTEGLMTIQSELEEEFDVTIDSDLMERAQTLGDLVELVGG